MPRRLVTLLLPAVIAAGCGTAYALLTLRRFATFQVTSWDNAIFEQVVAGWASGGWPITDVKGPGFNQLGDHFTPIVALVAPFYRLFPSAQTILLAQVVLIALSIWVVARLAVERLGPWAGGAIGLCYGLSYGLQSAVEVDFHEVAFAAPLLALAGAAYVRRDWTRVVLWSLPLLLVKEDLGVTVALIGVLLWCHGQRRKGWALVVTGLVTLAVVVLVVLPAFNPDGRYAYTSDVGGDAGVLTTLTTQLDTKAWTVLLTLLITGLLALASPWVLLVLPTFAWRFVGGVEYYWGTEFHYSLVIMPIVFVAMVDAAVRLREHVVWSWWARLAPVVALLATGFTLVHSPLTFLVGPEAWDDDTPRAVAAREVLSRLPAGTSVEADIGLLTHVVTHHTAYWVGTVGDAQPDYVLLDTRLGVGPADAVRYAQEAHGGTWRLVAEADGMQLATRQP